MKKYTFKPNNIYNLDALKYLKDIESNSIDLIITDPPYGINYYTNRRKKKTRKTENGILNDNKDNLKFIETIIKELYRVLKEGRHIYWFGRYDSIAKHIPLFEKVGFIIKNNLIWIKNNHGTGDLYYSYAPKYECILYAIKPGKKKFKLQEYEGIKRHPDVLYYDKIPSKKLIHDHQKPTELLEFLILKSSLKNELILDPFVGSGQTALAAFFNQRKFIGFEIDKGIYKMAKDRFKEFTKKEVKIGKNFAKLINAKYRQNNITNIFSIDGEIYINNKKFNIDLQELNSSFFIEKEKLIFDLISVFYFDKNTKKKKKYSYEEFKNLRNSGKIKLEKLGKIYTMNENDIYLIYISKNKISDKNNQILNAKYQDKEYIYLPFFVGDIRNYINKNHNKLKVFVNNKEKLKDTWESAYTVIDFNEIKDFIIDFNIEINQTLKI